VSPVVRLENSARVREVLAEWRKRLFHPAIRDHTRSRKARHDVPGVVQFVQTKHVAAVALTPQKALVEEKKESRHGSGNATCSVGRRGRYNGREL